MSTPALLALPPDANLKHLKYQAKDLLKAFKSRDAQALSRVRKTLPRMNKMSAGEIVRAEFTLSDAQFAIAREYGFESWAKLKHYVEGDPVKLLVAAVNDGDAKRVKALLNEYPPLAMKINEPLFAFDSPAIVAKSSDRELVDVLLAAGADINAKSKWWAGGFGVLHNHAARGALGKYLIRRGARVDAHAAANLNMRKELTALIDADPSVVNQRGPDGMVPLHWAATPEIATLLLDRGAEIDIRDLDHESTPAQYAIPYRPEVCKLLLRRGAEADIFMACVLDDVELARQLVKADPRCVEARIGKGKFVTTKSEGMHIYIYNLGYTETPLTLAERRGSKKVLKFLLEHSSTQKQFIFACRTVKTALAQKLLRAEPDLAQKLPPEDQAAIAEAAWEHNLPAVKLMLESGFAVNARGIHQSTPLDRASIRGYAEIVEYLLQHGPDLEAKNEFGGTPLSACMWGSVNFRDTKGDYPATVEKLIKAGAKLPKNVGGSDAVVRVLQRYGVKG